MRVERRTSTSHISKGKMFLSMVTNPFAGQTLNFSVEVVSIREATQEELTHGHAHGPGGHSH